MRRVTKLVVGSALTTLMLVAVPAVAEAARMMPPKFH